MVNVRSAQRRNILASALVLSTFGSLAAGPPPNPRVNVMPGYPNAPHCDPDEKRPVRPGQPVIVWGNANGGDGTAIGNSYAWSFSPNPNVSVTPVNPPLSGVITDDRYIFEEVTFTLLGGSTLECVTATLTVTFPGPVNISNQVEIRIVDPADPSSTAPLDNLAIDVAIAIQDGLRALYLKQDPSGAWLSSFGNEDCAVTAFALWAIQNHGHLASNPQNEDILAEFVEKGLDWLLANAAIAGTAATRADVPRGAVAAGVSDLNSNARSVQLCPGEVFYSPPVAAAAVIASLEPTRVVPAGPIAGTDYKTLLEDVIDWIGTVQTASPASGPRGGWFYFGPTVSSDMSINSWFYLALEGIEAVFPPCPSSSAGGGILVPDWIKQEAEYALIFHQTNAAGAQPFGYNSAAPLQGATHGIATTSGGLSGLALVETVQTVPVGDIIDNEPAPLNSVTAKRNAALRYLGDNWNETFNAQLLGYANRGNFYAMWTTARALRLTARALSLPAGTKVVLTHGGVSFDWETGETLIPALGNVPPAGDPREGYFPFLVRTQDTASGPLLRGQWSTGTYLQWHGASMETSMGLLILADRVFGPPCQISCEDIEVPCQGPDGAIVTFDIPVSGCADGTTVICDPPSGSLFPVGTTQVTCYAEEPCGKRRSLPCCFDVTVTEPCPCLEVKDERIECSGEVQGEYQYTFSVQNLSGVDVSRIRLLPCDGDGDFLPDFTMTPDTFNFSPAIPIGGSASLTVTLSGIDPDEKVCFEIWMFDRGFQRCCVLKHCVELPDCCLEVVKSRVECDPDVPGQYIWYFNVKNLAPYPIDRLFLWPPAGVTMTPSSFILPPIPPGGVSAELAVTISGPQAGDTVCLDITIHESATGDCCGETICLTFPECDPCKVDDSCHLPRITTLCPVQGSAVLEAVVKLTICNYCNEEPTAFEFSLDGITGGPCPNLVLSPGSFSPSSGVTPPIPRGECYTVAIRIQTNTGELPPGACACYAATITNAVTGDSFACRGKVQSPMDAIKGAGDPADPVDVPLGRPRPIAFEVTNLGSTALVFPFEITTALSGETSAQALSLDGLPPGEPVRGQIDLGAGATAAIAVDVSAGIHAPLSFFDVFLVTASADGLPRPIATTTVHSVLNVDCNQNGVPDDVDILVCTSEDTNGDGIPDECQDPLPIAAGKQTFRRGDTNADGSIDVSDGVAVLEYLFLGQAAPSCLDAADADDSGTLDLGDAVGVFGYLFLAGRAPREPGPEACGLDPTDDALTCFDHPPCR